MVSYPILIHILAPSPINSKSPIAYFQQLPAHLSRKNTRAISRTGRSSIMTSAPPLPRRQLGQTGLEVSVLGFGASPLGGVFQVHTPNHCVYPCLLRISSQATGYIFKVLFSKVTKLK